MNSVRHLFVSHLQFMTYAVFGAGATILDWAVFTLMTYGLGIHYQIAVTCAFLTGGSFKFLFNKKITFKNKSKKIHIQYPVFLMVTGIGLALNLLFMFGLVEMLGADRLLSRMIVTFLVLGVNYSLDKHVTFNRNIFRG